MKICPQCETGYHDSNTTCPTHGGMLSEIRDLRPGMLIRGTYRIVKKLGKGGMGAVYLAQHTLMDEPRALKFLSQEMSEDEAFTGRFLREVRMLRQLRNKNVVDCGDPERAEDGSLFFSMEFVDGPDLRSFLKTAPRPFDVRLALNITRSIAEGLGAAHSKGMVHRDIKPDNILMARDGESWVPKIADFGIVATKESSHQTKTGSMLLTMAYAAPEQWLGTRAAELDGRTDLYALGGVLFEMLVGHGVFDAENYHEWAQKHLHAVPPTPSRLRPDLAKWKGLDALVLRLLAKDRNDRPQNVSEFLAQLDAVVYDPHAPAAELAADPEAPTVFYQSPTVRPATAPPSSPHVAKPQDDETLVSGPIPGSQSGRFQQPSQVSMRSPVQNSLAFPSSAPAVPPPPVAPAAHTFSAAPNIPVSSVNTGGSPAGIPTSSRPPAANGEYQTLGRSTRRLPVDSRRSGKYPTASRTSRTGQAAVADEEEQESKASKGSRVWIWIVVLLLLAGGWYFTQRFYVPKVKSITLLSQSQPILSIAFSRNGATLASASHDNTIQFWNVSTGKALNDLQDEVDALAYSPDGRSIATADWDKNVKQWDVASGQVLATLDGHTGKVLCVAFSPDSHTLASGGIDKTIRLWDLTSEKVLRILQGHTADVNSIAFSPDGRTLASGSADNTIRLWDVATGKILNTLQGHTHAINSVVYSPDGHTLASGSDDMTIMLWDVATGKMTRTLTGHTGPVHSVAFSPDGRILASGSDDFTVKLWNVTGASAAFATLQGHSAAVNSVAFSPDGSIVASGSADNSIKLWDMSTVRN